MKIRHTGIVVADLARMQNYLTEVFDFRIVDEVAESGSYIDNLLQLEGCTVITSRLADEAGNLIELLHFPEIPHHPIWSGGVTSTGFTHIALTVRSVDETCQRIEASGGTLHSPPQEVGTVKAAYTRAPEGMIIELIEDGSFAIADALIVDRLKLQ